MKRSVLFTVVYIFLAFAMYSQEPVKVYEKGIPFLKNYTPEEMGAAAQNWAIVMDKRGVMYFGNQENGVIEFDGVNWVTIPISNNSAVKSLGIDESGTVYVGATGEFGYLQPGKTGKLQYKSLISKIDTSNREFNEIHNTFHFNNHIYFCSGHKIFKYSSYTDSLIVIDEGDYGFKYGFKSFPVNDRIYHGDYGAGLIEIDADTLRVAKGGDYFHVHSIMGMVPAEDNKILIGSYKKGVVLYDPETGVVEEDAISVDANNYVKEKALSQIISLGNGKLGLSTLYGGFIIVDNRGHIIQKFDKSTGLQDETVYFSYVNPSQPDQYPLWLALDIGIARIEINSPLTKFTEATGFKNSINDIIKYKGKLFIGTMSGVYYLEGDKLMNFKKIQDINTAVWSFLEFDTGRRNTGKLLAGSSEGLFDISGIEKGILIDENVVDIKPEGRKYYIWKLEQSSVNRNNLYLGMNSGIAILEYKNGIWHQTREIDFSQEIRSIAEQDNRLWLGSGYEGVKMIDFSNPNDTVITSFTVENGLPGNDQNIITRINDKVYFLTTKGLYYFNEKENKFMPDTAFGERYSNGEMEIFRMIKAESNNLWFSMQSGNKRWVEVLKLNDDETKELVPSLRRLPNNSTDAIYDDGDGNVWLGVSNELFKYECDFEKDLSLPYVSLVRKVNTGADSVIFFGSNYLVDSDGKLIIDLEQPEELIHEIDFKHNNLTFKWAAPFFEQEEATQYRYWLEGYSDEWSRWSDKTEFTFTNLSQGDYIFHVQASNIYGINSKPALYKFSISPPWYLTAFAFIIYFILVIVIIVVIVNLYTRKLRNENIRFEGIIAERTAEIRKQKEELEDSILYARRIQRALLPSQKILLENFPNHFILFKPRDIVSGDFYWMAKRKSKIFLVAADCTGHGVPGAFMSLLGISFLNEIIAKPDIEKPNEILDELRDYVMTSLKQTGEGEDETKDGMDLSLIVIDSENKKIQFSGAYNPLLVVRKLTANEKTKVDKGEEPDFPKGSVYNENYVLEQIRADKMPIGISAKKYNPFSFDEFTMKSGISFYMNSDGFIDQFGGPKGKKFMSKRFKKLILDIQDKTMKEQGEILDNAINEWIGEEYEQIDDILVVGLKID